MPIIIGWLLDEAWTILGPVGVTDRSLAEWLLDRAVQLPLEWLPKKSGHDFAVS